MSKRAPTVDELRQELLRNYQLADVTPVVDERGREVVINQGSYGRILKVLVSCALCAAKEIHASIIDGPDNLNVRQFIRECDLMSRMRHPNVVQFLGVYQPETNPHLVFQETLPWLIMEYVPFELHSLLGQPIEIPMSVRVSILLDITKGLSYLHNNHSLVEIIHRDLSARNVLLTSSLTAKLADFGTSRQPVQDAIMTKGTGNPLYMPPENQVGSKTRYNSKMDIFSFGVVMLFTIVKEFPNHLLPGTFTNSEKLVARSEVARRQRYFDRVERSPDPTVRTLVGICKNCLENEQGRRPTAENLTRQLSELTQATEMEKLQVIIRLQELDARRGESPNQHKEGEQETLGRNMVDADVVASLEAQLENLREQLDQQVARGQREASQLQYMQKEKAAAESKWRQQNRESTDHLRALQDQLSQTRRELVQSQDEVTRQVQELEHKEWQLREKQQALDCERELSDNYKRIINMADSEKLTRMQEIQSLQMALQSARDDLQRQNVNLSGQTEKTESEVARLKEHIKKNEDDIQSANEKAANYKSARDDLQRLNENLSGQIEKTESEVARLKEHIKQNDDIRSANEKAAYYKEQFENLKIISAEKDQSSCIANFPLLPPSGLKTTLTLNCSTQDPSPFGLHSAQCVRYQNKVLLGGAMQAAESNQKKVILSCDLNLGKWSRRGNDLTHRLRLMHFAMVVVNDKLLTVGGYHEANNQYSDQVFEYTESGSWKEFCRLPGRRARAAAFSYRNWLVVAGGCTDNAQPLDQVIALDCSTSSSSWKPLTSLPERIQDFQSASYTSLHHSDPTKDTAVVYLTSRRQGLKPTQPTMGASVPDLIHRGAQWMKIPNPPVRSPGVVTLRGHLLALGGQDSKHPNTLSNKVYMYHLGTREWLPVAEVSNPRAMCVCVGLSDTKFMVLGGKDKTTEYSPTVEVFNLPSLQQTLGSGSL